MSIVKLIDKVSESKCFINMVCLLCMVYVVWSVTTMIQLQNALSASNSRLLILLEKIDTSVPTTVPTFESKPTTRNINVQENEDSTLVAWNTSYLVPDEIFKGNDKLLNTIGIKNNNPCNVKTPKSGNWYGQIGTDKFGHAIFTHPTYSLRASAMTLINYQKRHGCKTLTDIIERYCESSKDQYVEFLAKRLGVKPDDEIDVMRVMPKLLHAIVTFETGSNPYPKLWYDAFAMYAPLS